MKLLFVLLFAFVSSGRAQNGGEGASCYVRGRTLNCDEGLSCSNETRKCEYTNICASTACAMFIPNCSNGTKLLPKDPSKCRCCGNTCGVDDNQTGCESGQTCNSKTGRCESTSTNICNKMMCPMSIPVCENGTHVLPADPSKCRCCARTCGTDDNQTGCESGQTCNSKTGECESTSTNICTTRMCPMYMPVCENGTHVLPRDPSKCRCCALTCGTDDNQTGCTAGETCNAVTGVCEARQG